MLHHLCSSWTASIPAHQLRVVRVFSSCSEFRPWSTLPPPPQQGLPLFPGCYRTCNPGISAPERGSARSMSPRSRCRGSIPGGGGEEEHGSACSSQVHRRVIGKMHGHNAWSSGQFVAYHLLLVELRHRRGGDLLVELLPRVGHVAGGARADRA